MSRDLTNLSVLPVWLANWPLHPPAWSRPQAAPFAGFLTTSEANGVGDVARTWVLRLENQVETPSRLQAFFSFGIEWLSDDGDRAARLLVTPDGGLSGWHGPGHKLRLFQAGREIELQPPRTELATGSGLFRLTTLPRPDRTYFRIDTAGAVGTAQEAEEIVDALFEEEIQRRASFWKGVRAPAASRELLAIALETLVGTLRASGKPDEPRWYACGAPGFESMDINQFYPLVAAWCRLDPSVAENLLKGIFDLQADNGGFARSYPLQAREEGISPWPLLAQAVECAWHATGGMPWLKAKLPDLQRYLNWSLDHFLRRSFDRHCWNSASEAFVPEAFLPGGSSADLAAMLLCEIEAFRSLVSLAGGAPLDTRCLDEQYELLYANLETLYWDSGKKCFRDRLPNGEFSERLTLSSLLPLAWRYLPDEYIEPSVDLAVQSDLLATLRGFRVANALPTDSHPSPISLLRQSVVVNLIAEAGVHSRFFESLDGVLPELSRLFDPARGLPENATQWTTSPPDRGGGPEWTSAAGTCLVILASVVHSPEQQRRRPSPVVRWLDRHRGPVLATCLALLVLCTVAASLLLAFRGTMTPVQFETNAGLAMEQHRRGNYQEAARIYEALLKKHPSPSLHEKLAAAYFGQQRWEDAEAQYRLAMKEGTNSPAPLLNLGTVLREQGRREEALEMYGRVIKEFGSGWPQEAARAQAAITLLGGGAGPVEP